MDLLCFAHRAEAEAFFVNQSYSSVKKAHNLYLHSDGGTLVLIHGEGTHQTMTKICEVFGIFPEIKNVLNLGVAGSTCSSLRKNEIISIRTCYLGETSRGVSPEFKSFTLKEIDGLGCSDVMTTSRRVTDPKKKEIINHFADLIDRELWAICFSSKHFNKNIYSLKIVSDEVQEENFCQNVKDHAFALSLELYKAYQKYYLNKESNLNSTNDKCFKYLATNKSFYMTTSQKRLIVKVLRDLKLNLNDLKIIINSLELNDNNKANSKILINALQERISPELSALKKSSTKLTKNLTSSGIRLQTDRTFESSRVSFSFDANDKNEFLKKVLALGNFSFEDWENFIEGHQ